MPPAPPPPPPPPVPTLASSSASRINLAEQLAGAAASRTDKVAALAALESRVGPKAPLLCEGSDDFHRLMEEAQFEKYWTAIEPYTFRSAMVPLTREDVIAMYEGYDRAQQTGHRWPSVEPTVVESSPLDSALAAVAEKVEQGYQQLGLVVGTPAFVRLSSRSAKDAILCCPGVDFRGKLDGLTARVAAEEARFFAAHPEVPPSSELNQKLHVQYIASTELLATTTGVEAVERFLYSERVQEDLHEAASKMEEDAQFVFNIVVRELGMFEVRNEIRGFVYNQKLTALTQYNQTCYFPQALLEREGVIAACTEFVETLIPALAADPSSAGLANFVVDLVMLNDGRVMVIELNPFAEFAGSGLFSWEKQSDLDVLLGRSPFEYRVVERLPKPTIVEASLTPEYWNMLQEM
jgi:hypothetical protein